MKKITLFAIVSVLLVAVVAFSSIGDASAKNACTTIQSGELFGSDGNVLAIDFDDWGYNYQSRMFKGGYCDAYRDAGLVPRL